MNPLANTFVYFLVPGNINNLTGGYAYDRRLLAELHQLGLNIQLIDLAESFPYPDANALQDANRKITHLPDNSVVIVDGLAFGVMGEIAQEHAQRLKFIALCHHPLALEAGLSEQQQQHFRISERRALSATRAVLVTSNNTARILEQEFVVSLDKIHVALPGIDKRVIISDDSSVDEQPLALSESEPLILLTVATLTRRKAHDVLIDALAQLKNLSWQAHFVGGDHFDPDWANYLRSKVISFGLENRILFLGNREDISSNYQHADIFILPSLFEGYGMAIAEALSFGLPVIAAHTGAVPDLVPPSAGILVPPGDVNLLANSIADLATDSTKRTQLQSGAKKAAQDFPSWKNTADIVYQLIQKVSQ